MSTKYVDDWFKCALSFEYKELLIEFDSYDDERYGLKYFEYSERKKFGDFDINYSYFKSRFPSIDVEKNKNTWFY